ncbi:MAG TPA: hypothetical protein VHQ47_00690 [Phycisphaerae bacterium]|nr:hypothetical protein [Phycisphaerae bacterium]
MWRYGVAAVLAGMGAAGLWAKGAGQGTAASEPATAEARKQVVAPGAGEFVRYERVMSGFRTTAVTKAHGDAVFAALHRGTTLLDWGAWTWAHETPEQRRMLVEPVLTDVHVEGIRKDGTRYEVSVSREGGLVELQGVAGLYAEIAPGDAEMQKAMADVEGDLRKAVQGAARPTTYAMGVLEDEGTLSGVAKLFYGDARRWKDIYAANRGAIKNPDRIVAGMKLVIPE